MSFLNQVASIFIWPESDHWECLPLTDWLTDSCLVDLIDVTLACEDANWKLVEVLMLRKEVTFVAELNPCVCCAFGNVFHKSDHQMLPFFLYIGRFSGTDCQLAGKDRKSCNILLFSGLPCISNKKPKIKMDQSLTSLILKTLCKCTNY